MLVTAEIGVLIFRGVMLLLVVLAVMASCGKLESLVQGPLKAQLEASRGNQAAGKAAVEHQNAGVDGLTSAGKKKKAESAAAVKKAGKADFNRAQGLRTQPAKGSTPAERANNLIDTELGLK